MNFYTARKTLVGDIWRWTCANGEQIWTSTPCTEECQHATREEAERHYYEYRMSKLRTFEFEHWEECEHPECKVEDGHRTLTNKMLGEVGSILRGKMLCDQHRTEAVYRQLTPFVPGSEIWSS